MIRFHKPSPEEYFNWWWKAVRKLLSSKRKNQDELDKPYPSMHLPWKKKKHPFVIPSKSPRHNWSCSCRGSLGGKGLWQLIKGTIAVETCFHLKQLSFLGWQFFCWWKKNNLLISKPTNSCQLPDFWKRPMLCYVNWENYWWNHKDLYTIIACESVWATSRFTSPTKNHPAFRWCFLGTCTSSNDDWEACQNLSLGPLFRTGRHISEL